MAPYDRTTWPRTLVRASTACLIFALGLGAAGVTSTLAADAGAPAGWQRAAAAATTLGIVLPLILVLGRRRGRSTPGRPREALTGLAVVGGAAVITFGIATAVGSLRVRSVDPGAFATFLVINSLTALALEAIPEELTFRGYVAGTLRARTGAWRTGVITTALFVLAPGLAGVVGWALGRAFGVPVPPPSIAPAGNHPVDYVVLLTIFGAMLVALRLVTGSVWACVAAHLLFLTVNRALLSPARYDAGLVVDAAPGSELLVPVYLLLALGLTGLIARRRRASRRDRAGTAGTVRPSS